MVASHRLPGDDATAGPTCQRDVRVTERVASGTVRPVNGAHPAAAERPRSSFLAKGVFVAKSLARRLRWLPRDAVDRLSGKRSLGRPPKGISFVGGGDSTEVGQWYVGQFESIGGLGQGDRVLDIGCGIGRMAVPLVDYLDRGSYEGFDTSATMVKWCQRNITRTEPRFNFKVASIYNAKYNPFGTVPADQYSFPYEDDSFDFAFATSVFTHLGIDDASRYLAETARVLKPGGTAFFTFFLLGTRQGNDLGDPAFRFDHPFGPLRTTDPREPEAAVAWPEDLLLDQVETHGLKLKRPIIHGSWNERNVGADIQDVVVLTAGE